MPCISPDTSTLRENSSTKPNSNISSDLKQNEKKPNFLTKYLISKDGKEPSISEINNNILEKLKRPLNINLSNVDRNCSKNKESFKEKFNIENFREIKNIRNIKKSILDSKVLNLTDIQINNISTNIICPRNSNKLNESKSFILNGEKKKDKEDSIQSSSKINLEKENFKNRISKKLDFTCINNQSTKDTAYASSNISNNENVNSNTFSLIKRFSNKNSSYNIKNILELNTKKMYFANLPNLSKKP